MGFNIMDLMNGATRAAVEGVDNYEAITLNLDEIKVTKHNRYSMDDLEELATSILMDGLQEPLFCRTRDTRRLRRTSRAALRT